MIDRSLKMMFQKILEQEVKDYLGRDYYERGAGSSKGYRNGYEPKRLKSAEGEINLEAPQLRDKRTGKSLMSKDGVSELNEDTNVSGK